jgi:hypothetical protein
MSTQKKVVVRWDAGGLRAEPEEIKVHSRIETLHWELVSSHRGARITAVTFEEDGTGPFARVAGSSDILWQSEGSMEKPLGRRYKYSVFVRNAGGASEELDPFVVDTDKP